MKESKLFSADGTFKAYYAACDWCSDSGFSVGTMDGRNPIGLIRGDANIEKWHNLSKKEIAALDGKMTGDMRNGPVTVEIF
ncbi:MAG: hypothetical protein UY18_C0050G0011 [Microgenomates group bacterium GW2011_GWF2_47_9]|nr:MAG: hypothetical protein UY18_C0050G0011 [Microgenomates group bacterium GW2011_GWF2_47_9]